MATPAAISALGEQENERVERRARIPRWVGIVLPVAILGGVGLVFLNDVNQSWLPVVLLLGGSAALGLLVGLAARRSLPHHSNFIRWVVAMGAVTVGLLAAGIASAGRVGLGPLLPLGTQFRWVEVMQLASAGLAAWLAVRAFARPAPLLSEAPPLPGESNWGFTYHPAIHDTQPIRARPRRARPLGAAVERGAGRATVAAAGTARASTFRPANSLQQGYARLRARLERAANWRPPFGLLPSQRKSSPIRFTGAAEDRCPYCLAIVEEHDRRGVTVCPVCHTRHHAECWAVTGTCQMPHLYADGSRPSHVDRPGAAR